MSIAPTIHIKNASLRYQNTLLFDHLNLTLPAGKWTCLLGPSGVGKTSLLRLIAGLTPLTDVGITSPITTSDHSSLMGRVAYMAQNDLLMPWYSALHNVLLGAHLRGENLKLKKNQALSLLEKVGLKNAVNKRPEELSGGMRQRVALARTLMENRPVVLMDEPFGSLDAITRLRLQDLAAELLQNRTVLLVTHDPLEALRLADQIYVMTGLPATVGDAIVPPGKPPRDLHMPGLLELQAELLRQLSEVNDNV